MNRTDLRNETTLGHIAENVEKATHSCVFGVIIDITECHKKKEGEKFITSLKIIDPSFNYKQQIKNDGLKFHKFVKINIYTETVESAPKVQYIGDIIRLRRFQYKILDNRGQMIGYETNFSNWLLYKGYEENPSKDANVSYKYKNMKKNDDRQNNEFENNRLHDLRFWSRQFFSINSISYINWWNWIGIKNNEVDLIVKLQEIIKDGNKRHLKFADEKNTYLLKQKDPQVSNIGQLFYLRCFNVVPPTGKLKSQATYELKQTTQSGALLIPHYFYDYLKFNNINEQKPKQMTPLLEHYTFLKNYNLKDVNISKGKSTPIKGKTLVSVYKNIYDKTFSDVKELNKVYNNANINRNNIFLFEGSIVGFSDTKPKNIIKVMNQNDKTFVDLDTFLKKKKFAKHRAVFHFQMQIKDSSSNKPLTVYISTVDGDHHLFTSWDIIPESDLPGWAHVKEKDLSDFEQKLLSVKKESNKCQLCLKFQVTKDGKGFFKLIDTVFLPLQFNLLQQ